MSAPSCDTVREYAPDFALGALTGRERAEVVAHLDDCPACQALVGEYASVADSLLELIPEAEPTAELAPPVLAAMRPSPQPRWRHRVVALAAAAIIAISGATGLTVALVSRGGGGNSSTAAPALHSAPMVGSGNLTVGRVVSTGDRAPKLAISVDYWVPDGRYQLAARDGRGDSGVVGTLEVSGGRGTWTGRSALSHPVAVELVDQSGNIVCQGRLA
ncbi:MAG TPA: zf-HC2 domain-containing protein [Acidimicrobiia bacterium]|nr:zf-HC2 domain-containing protein [Acidimicrobiia bacterium]